MTLKELASEYRESARLVRGRASELRAVLLTEKLSETETLRLRGRLAMLEGMLHDAQETALFLEHYYDTEYRHNARYRI